jgi:WD40 repeat protein
VWDEESGALHRELEGFDIAAHTCVLATFTSADGQQPRLVAGSQRGQLLVHDPEAGSLLHRLEGHNDAIADVACIASSSAAPHHPRLVSASHDRTAKVWDGETGEMLADLPCQGPANTVTVWKEPTGGRDRIATAGAAELRVWDGEAFTLLHDLHCGAVVRRLVPFQAADGTSRLLAALYGEQGVQVYDPEEGRRLHDGINRRCPLDDVHLLASAQGRQRLAIVGVGSRHPRHPGDLRMRPFLDVWDLGEAPAAVKNVRPAHHLG